MVNQKDFDTKLSTLEELVTQNQELTLPANSAGIDYSLKPVPEDVYQELQQTFDNYKALAETAQEAAKALFELIYCEKPDQRTELAR